LDWPLQRGGCEPGRERKKTQSMHGQKGRRGVGRGYPGVTPARLNEGGKTKGDQSGAGKKIGAEKKKIVAEVPTGTGIQCNVEKIGGGKRDQP